MTAPRNQTATPTGGEGTQPGGRVTGEAETGRAGRAGAGDWRRTSAAGVSCQLGKVRLATHLVLCTPGLAGTITRAGYPWSSESSAPLTRSASSESGSMICPADRTAVPEGAAPLQRLHQHARRPADAGQPGQIAQPHSGPGLVVGGPALDAGDRQVRGVLLHAPASSARLRRTGGADRSRPALVEGEPPARAGLRRPDARPRPRSG